MTGVSGGFRDAARAALEDTQLRRNLRGATTAIREKRAAVVREVGDWEALREAARAVKDHTLANLPVYLEQLEASVQRAGGTVHWASDAATANRIVTKLVHDAGVQEVVKVKSITTDEIGLNTALADAGIRAIETDLAELIIQLAGERSSHFLVPAIHKNRAEIGELFRRHLGLAEHTDEPAVLADTARRYLRAAFLRARVGISGANLAVAETGTVCVVESEGNGRMCTTLPSTLITIMGIEKVIPRWRDVAAFLTLLPRSATGERMNPYTSFWTGVTPGDGPRHFHLVLLDNGRSDVLADPVGREALRCIRCSACLNVCPVYARVGGHAYHSVYPGPIGAVLTPQLRGPGSADELPFASTLCGACADVCPVKIDIPRLLVHLRRRALHPSSQSASDISSRLERTAMRFLRWVFVSPERYERAQRWGRVMQRPWVRGGVITRLPPGLRGWSVVRDTSPIPPQSFRAWWRTRAGGTAASRRGPGG